MRFVQLIEFAGTQAEFERMLDRYRELAGDSTRARGARLFADRDRPGVLYEMVEFDSAEDAAANDELPATQQFAAENAATFGTAVFRNLDELAIYAV